MATIMLYGTFVPAYFADIRKDPEGALRDFSTVAEAANCRVIHFFFASDDQDFYCFVEGENPVELAAVKGVLLSKGHYARMNGDFIFSAAELLPVLESVAKKVG